MMDFKFEMEYAKRTIEEYGFWDRIVRPYNFNMTVRELFNNWTGYDNMTSDSRAICRDELAGFLPILNKWVVYENQPTKKVILIQGPNAGQIKELKESTARDYISVGFAKEA